MKVIWTMSPGANNDITSIILGYMGGKSVPYFTVNVVVNIIGLTIHNRIRAIKGRNTHTGGNSIRNISACHVSGGRVMSRGWIIITRKNNLFGLIQLGGHNK